MNYPQDFIDKIIPGDCLDLMSLLPTESVDMVMTSPPYWNLRDYSYWSTYDEYLESVHKWFVQISRVVKRGRHVCWNIQPYLPSKLNKERYHIPISADTIKIAYEYGFMLERTVIWNKTNATCQRMFGSYPYPPTIIYTPKIEDIHIFKKLGKANLDNKNDLSKLTLEEWSLWTLPIWDMSIGMDNKYNNRKNGNHHHNATFPEELPKRCISLHSFVGDIILDPFIGTGTTAKVAKRLGRHFIGFEIDERSISIANSRIRDILEA